MAGETKNNPDLKPYETEPNAKGVKDVVSYRTDENGVTYKVVKKVKVIKKVEKIPKGVLDRKNNWKKFGEVAKVPNGELEMGVSYFGDEVFFEPSTIKKEDTKDEEKPEIATITCRHCGGTHWSHKCTKHIPESRETKQSTTGAYVPPRKRRGESRDPTEEVTTLRISNLSEICSEDDLRNVFQRYGYIQRIYLARDRETKIPRGFAYVTFEQRKEAEAALKNTVGVGLDHLIWSIDWARS